MIRTTKILIVITVLFLPSLIFSKNAFVNKSESLEEQISALEKKITEVNVRSKKVKKITEKFKLIALGNKRVVLSYLNQKSSCLNLENKYKLLREQKKLSNRVIKFQDKNTNECYQRVEAINLKYDEMNEEFEGLQNEISELKDIIEADGGNVESYQLQAKLLREMVQHNKDLKSLSPNEIEDTIVEITKDD